MDTNSYAFIRGYLANRRFIRKIIKRSIKETILWKKYYGDSEKLQEARGLRKEIVQLQKEIDKSREKIINTKIINWVFES